MAALFDAEGMRNETYEEEVVSLSAQIFTKAFPEYMKTYGQEELKTSIAKALSDQAVPAKITIELNETILDGLSDFIKQQETELGKQITLKHDSTLPDHDCRISWPEGGVICNRDSTAEKIFDILNQSLAERGISLHDEAEKKTDEDQKPEDADETSGDS